jgi:hypothetical protein
LFCASYASFFIKPPTSRRLDSFLYEAAQNLISSRFKIQDLNKKIKNI